MLRKNENAFTLIELIAVTALLAIMATILYKTLSNIQRSIRLIDNQRSAGRTAQIVLTRLSRELASCYQKPLGTDVATPPPNPPPFPQSSSMLIGTGKDSGKTQSDSIRFVTEGISDANVGNPGVVEVTYQLTEIEGSRGNVLIRDEVPWGVIDKETVKKHHLSWPIAENIVLLNFRYYQQQDGWKNEWKAPRLPLAVEITLQVKGDNGKIETYKTAIALTKKQKTPNQSIPPLPVPQ